MPSTALFNCTGAVGLRTKGGESNGKNPAACNMKKGAWGADSGSGSSGSSSSEYSESDSVSEPTPKKGPLKQNGPTKDKTREAPKGTGKPNRKSESESSFSDETESQSDETGSDKKLKSKPTNKPPEDTKRRSTIQNPSEKTKPETKTTKNDQKDIGNQSAAKRVSLDPPTKEEKTDSPKKSKMPDQRDTQNIKKMSAQADSSGKRTSGDEGKADLHGKGEAAANKEKIPPTQADTTNKRKMTAQLFQAGTTATPPPVGTNGRKEVTEKKDSGNSDKRTTENWKKDPNKTPDKQSKKGCCPVAKNWDKEKDTGQSCCPHAKKNKDEEIDTKIDKQKEKDWHHKLLRKCDAFLKKMKRTEEKPDMKCKDKPSRSPCCTEIAKFGSYRDKKKGDKTNEKKDTCLNCQCDKCVSKKKEGHKTSESEEEKDQTFACCQHRSKKKMKDTESKEREASEERKKKDHCEYCGSKMKNKETESDKAKEICKCCGQRMNDKEQTVHLEVCCPACTAKNKEEKGEPEYIYECCGRRVNTKKQKQKSAQASDGEYSEKFDTIQAIQCGKGNIQGFPDLEDSSIHIQRHNQKQKQKEVVEGCCPLCKPKQQDTKPKHGHRVPAKPKHGGHRVPSKKTREREYQAQCGEGYIQLFSELEQSDPVQSDIDMPVWHREGQQLYVAKEHQPYTIERQQRSRRDEASEQDHDAEDEAKQKRSEVIASMLERLDTLEQHDQTLCADLKEINELLKETHLQIIQHNANTRKEEELSAVMKIIEEVEMKNLRRGVGLPLSLACNRCAFRSPLRVMFENRFSPSIRYLSGQQLLPEREYSGHFGLGPLRMMQEAAMRRMTETSPMNNSLSTITRRTDPVDDRSTDTLRNMQVSDFTFDSRQPSESRAIAEYQAKRQMMSELANIAENHFNLDSRKATLYEKTLEKQRYGIEMSTKYLPKPGQFLEERITGVREGSRELTELLKLNRLNQISVLLQYLGDECQRLLKLAHRDIPGCEQMFEGEDLVTPLNFGPYLDQKTDPVQFMGFSRDLQSNIDELIGSYVSLRSQASAKSERNSQSVQASLASINESSFDSFGNYSWVSQEDNRGTPTPRNLDNVHSKWVSRDTNKVNQQNQVNSSQDLCVIHPTWMDHGDYRSNGELVDSPTQTSEQLSQADHRVHFLCHEPSDHQAQIKQKHEGKPVKSIMKYPREKLTNCVGNDQESGAEASNSGTVSQSYFPHTEGIFAGDQTTQQHTQGIDPKVARILKLDGNIKK